MNKKMLQFHWYHQVTLISHLLLWMIRKLIFKSYIFETSLCHTPAWAARYKQHIYCMKNRLIKLWMSVDNRHGCFSLQYSAHLACLSVLTRQVKCTPAAFLTSLTLFFMLSSSSAVRACARHPSIDHSFKRSAFVVGGRLGSAWCDTLV